MFLILSGDRLRHQDSRRKWQITSSADRVFGHVALLSKSRFDGVKRRYRFARQKRRRPVGRHRACNLETKGQAIYERSRLSSRSFFPRKLTIWRQIRIVIAGKN